MHEKYGDLQNELLPGVPKLLPQFLFFAYISARENDKILMFCFTMRSENFYKNCIRKSLLTGSPAVCHTQYEHPIG